MTKKTVLVTGFGPFTGHTVNASWECVKLLKELGLGDDVDLIIYELPVEYATTKKIIPDMWSKHKPDLVVHVGVSDWVTEVTLEQQAHNRGYDEKDIRGCSADGMCYMLDAEDYIVTGLDVKHICEIVNQSSIKTKAVISIADTGRYLCDFSYFASLHQDRNRAAFIHVPPLDKPYTVQELTEALTVAILAMLDCVNNMPL